MVRDNRNEPRHKKVALLFAGIATVLAATLSMIFVSWNSQLLAYPSLVFALSSSAYILIHYSDDLEFKTKIVSLFSVTDRITAFKPNLDLISKESIYLPSPQLFDTCVFTIIGILALIPRTTELGLPLYYYWLLSGLAAVLAIKALLQPTRLMLLQLVLTAIVIRSSIWFSAPIVGRDPRFHQTFVEHVINQGTIVVGTTPDLITYYGWYPMAHIGSAMTALITATPARQSMFLAIGFIYSISIVAVYLFTTNVLSSSLSSGNVHRAGLLAALVITFAPSHIERGGILIAQSLGVAFVPFILYTISRLEDQRFVIIYIISVITVVITHNLTPMEVTFILFSLLIAQRLIQQATSLFTKFSTPSYWRSIGTRHRLSAAVFVGVLTIIYWAYIGYFQLQVFRLERLFRAEDNIQSTTAASDLTAAYGFTLADPVLHIGIDQFVFAAVFIIYIYFLIAYGTASLRRFPVSLILAGLFVYIALSLSVLSGHGEALYDIMRALTGIGFIVAPIFGALACELKKSGTAGIAVVIFLLLLFPLSGVVAVSYGVPNSGIAPTERTAGTLDYLSASEKAALEQVLSENHQRRVITDEYMATTETSWTLRPEPEKVRSVGMMHEFNERTFERRISDDKSTLILYRTTYQRFDLYLTSECSTSYDSGDAQFSYCSEKNTRDSIQYNNKNVYNT